MLGACSTTKQFLDRFAFVIWYAGRRIPSRLGSRTDAASRTRWRRMPNAILLVRTLSVRVTRPLRRAHADPPTALTVLARRKKVSRQLKIWLHRLRRGRREKKGGNDATKTSLAQQPVSRLRRKSQMQPRRRWTNNVRQTI